MSSNSICNHTRDERNRTLATWSSEFVNHSYGYRPNWSPLSPISVINRARSADYSLEGRRLQDILILMYKVKRHRSTYNGSIPSQL